VRLLGINRIRTSEITDLIANAPPGEVKLSYVGAFLDDSGEAIKDTLGHLTDYMLHTGITKGLTKSVNAGNPKLVDIEAGEGIIIDRSDPLNPVLTRVIFLGAVGVTDPNLTLSLSHVYIDSAGVLTVEATRPTKTDIETRLSLGGLVHDTVAEIILFPTPDPIIAYGSSATEIEELVLSGGKTLDGGIITPASNDLSLDVIAAIVSQYGRNFVTNPGSPNNPNIPARAPIPAANFFKAFVEAGGDLNLDNSSNQLDPSLINTDGLGTLGTLMNNTFSVIRVFISATDNNFVIYYGTKQYDSAEQGLAEASFETTFQEHISTKTISPVANIAIREDVTDLAAALLTDPLQAIIMPVRIRT